MEIVTSYETLFRYAKELGDAKKSGDEERIKTAQANHDSYRDLCLKADRMVTPFTYRELRG